MAARDEVDRNRSSYPPMFSANCRPGMARESEGRRRHLDYGEAQSFRLSRARIENWLTPNPVGARASS